MTRYTPIVAALLFAGQTQAAVVLGNLNSTTPGDPLLFGSTTTIDATQAKAVTFTVGQDLRLGSVYLGLSNFDDADIFDVFLGSLSGTSITRLADLALIAPTRTTSNSALVWQFDLTGASEFIFHPGPTYALTLKGGGGTAYTWGREGLDPIPPIGLATFGGYYFSDTGGATYAVSTDTALTNSFNIQGTEVPAPAPVILLAPALAWLVSRRRRG